MQSNGSSCGATVTAKLFSTIHVTSEERATRRLGKMDVERNLVFRGVAINAAKNSYPDHRLKVLATSRSFVVQTPGKVSTYLFRSEIGGQVKVLVEMKNNEYRVYVKFHLWNFGTAKMICL